MTTATIFGAVRWTLSIVILRRISLLILYFYIIRFVPRDVYGQFALHTNFLVILAVVVPIGMEFLHVSANDERYLRGLLQTVLYTGLGLSLLYMVVSVRIEEWYSAPGLSQVILVTGPMVMVYGLRRMMRLHHRKRMLFGRTAIFETVNVVIYTVGMIVFVPVYPVIWTIVVCYFAGDIIETVLLVVSAARTAGMLPRKNDGVPYEAAGDTLRKNRRYCSVTTGMHVLGHFTDNAPALILGLYAPMEWIGIYFLAGQMLRMPVNMLAESLSQVFLPVFSQTDREGIRRGLLRYTRMTVLVSWPLMLWYVLLLVIIVPEIAPAEWSAAVALLPLLSIRYFSSLLINPVSVIPIVLRQPQRELVWRIYGAAIMAGALWGAGIAVREGRISMLSVIGLFAGLQALLHLDYLRILGSLTGAGFFGLLRAILPGMAGVAVLGAALYGVSTIGWIWALTSSVAIMAGYFLLTDSFFNHEIRYVVAGVLRTRE